MRRPWLSARETEMSRDLAPSSNPVSRSSLFRKVEKAFVVLALLFYADAGLNLLTGDTRIPAGDQKRLELQLALYALAAIFILPCWKQMLRAATKLKLVLGILPLAFISILWSDSPRYTCTHALWLCATTAFALYFGVRFRRREQVSLVVLALAIAGVASIALGIFAPQYSVDHTFHQGQWRGVFSTKNSLGKAMSMEWAGALLIFSTNRTLGMVSGILAALLIAASGSRTALAVCLFLLLCFALFHAISRPAKTIAPLLLAAAIPVLLVVAWASSNAGSILAAAGRDSTLSGRTSLWTFVSIAISRRPWTGYGFDAFWLDSSGDDLYVIQNIGWNPPHAHNGFLDVTLAFGLVGIAFFACGFLQTACRAFVDLRNLTSPCSGWPLLFLAFLVVSNLTESSLLQINSIYWFLYVAIAASMAIERYAMPGAFAMKEAWS